MITIDEYSQFANWKSEHNKDMYTRQQVLWARFFLEHSDTIAAIGDIQTVLKDVRSYIRK